MIPSSIIFHLVIPQDVAVLRPLIILARSLPGKRVEMLVSKHLTAVSAGAEIAKISADLDLPPTYCDSGPDACRQLTGKSGILIVGHESSVLPHEWTHGLFKALPSSLLKVTLQHGFECVGFLHNAAHDANYGREVRFAADVVVSWFAANRLTALHPAEREKLFVAGPPIMIEPRRPRPRPVGPRRAMVCENFHSVRFTAPAVYESFLEQFFTFAERMAMTGGQIDFRPHPAGRFSDRMGLRLPAGVARNDRPLYEQDLGAFGFAVSAPSSILFDFLVAGVPTAVWNDAAGRMDCANFAGLETVTSAEEWSSFAARSDHRREAMLADQERFIDRLGIPSDVAGRYAELLSRAD